ncbi:MAG: tetratricopeptide repeat protein [Ignavibacteria bacterium]|nr:tetratricopeptide repeat protein [Ignavibacteria bacterium]
MKQILIPIIILAINFSILSQPITERLHSEALLNIQQGRYGEAIELLNRYISANPQVPEGFSLRGFCYKSRGQFEMAIYDYRSALKLEPDNKEYKSNLDRTIEEFNKQLYNYIEGYKREIAINPSVGLNYLEIGKNYKRLGEWQEAEKWYDDFLNREEPSADEVLRYTEILAKIKHIKKGSSILKKLTQKYPDDHRLWSRYGYFTMWLAKKIISKNAFEKALELRPYFKEAINGYDMVRGKGYVYTVNDTTTRYNYGLPVRQKYKPYPIDKYFKILRKNPDDYATRYLLVNELVKNNRFDEADKQLNILSKTQSGNKIYQNLKNEALVKQEQFYDKKIYSLEVKLSSDPYNRDTIYKLAKYYSRSEEHSKAVSLLNGYLSARPGDNEIRYQKALVLSEINNLKAARDELEILLNSDPSNYDYQLLYGQVLVWLNEELDIAYKYLFSVFSHDPKNLQTLIALASLNFQINDIVSAQKYLNLGYHLEFSNKDLFEIEKSINIQAKRNEKAKNYRLLEQAREFVLNKHCNDAIYNYKQYFKNPLADPYLKQELAQAYLCEENYKEALKIYNELLLEYPGDFNLAKQQAKIYYWNGDSLASLYAFEKLNSLEQDDNEIKLFLGDSYMRIGDYKNARKIYEELLVTSPLSQILQTRMKLLGNAGLDGYPTSAFSTHLSIVPSGNYFKDNLDFAYNTQGVRLQLGVTSYLSLAINGYIGSVSSESTTLNLNIFRADGYFKLSKNVSGYVGAGITSFDGDENTKIIEASIMTAKENKYNFSAQFYSSDAVLLLYSPHLVDVRHTANYALFTGEYIIHTILFKADYGYISVSDNNEGSKVILRAGKMFNKVFGVGYEFYFYDFIDQTPLYWSPNNFEAHSIWAYWDLMVGNEFVLNLKGKVGIIPSENNLMVREFQANFIDKFTENFVLQLSFFLGSSVRDNEGYQSTSVGLSIFWTL